MSVVIDGTLGITSPAETVQGALTTTGNTILGDSSADTLNVGNGGLVKDASGNVGIGTASPAYKLDASGTIRANGGYFRSTITYTVETGADILGTTGGMTSIGANPLVFGTDGTEQARITAAGLFQFNSGYGSVATAYGCRAWVNFNGTGTVAIRGSGNVSSITDNAVGEYTVNFTTAMVDANYAYVGTCKDVSGGAATSMYPAGAQTTSSCSIQTVTISPIAEADKAFVWCAFFR